MDSLGDIGAENMQQPQYEDDILQVNTFMKAIAYYSNEGEDVTPLVSEVERILEAYGRVGVQPTIETGTYEQTRQERVVKNLHKLDLIQRRLREMRKDELAFGLDETVRLFNEELKRGTVYPSPPLRIETIQSTDKYL